MTDHRSDDSQRPDPDGDGVSFSSRRRFLGRLGLALGGLIPLLAALPVVGFLFSPVRRREVEAWRPVGLLEEFPVGDTVMVRYIDPEPLPWAGFAGLSFAWLRRESEAELVAFSMYCTHTGCPVTWAPGAEMFMCPCHGGTFHRDGSVAAGPPPRPLERLPVRVRDGQVELRTLGAPHTG
jgi:menaquinol-cytochrome c reductase iron-sulfur subunit